MNEAKVLIGRSSSWWTLHNGYRPRRRVSQRACSWCAFMQDVSQRVQQGAGSFLSLGDRIVTVEEHSLLREQQMRRCFLAPELDGAYRHRNPSFVGEHLVRVDDPLF